MVLQSDLLGAGTGGRGGWCWEPAGIPPSCSLGASPRGLSSWASLGSHTQCGGLKLLTRQYPRRTRHQCSAFLCPSLRHDIVSLHPTLLVESHKTTQIQEEGTQTLPLDEKLNVFKTKSY